MTEPKRMRTNRALTGQKCRWCARPLAFGDEVAVCPACDGRHHARCWDAKGGCALAACESAPAPPEPAASAAPAASAPRRKRPRLVDSSAPGAQASLIWGLVGLVLCPLVGIIAILEANKAKRAIARDRRLQGAGSATAGAVLGWISILWFGLAFALGLLSVLSRR